MALIIATFDDGKSEPKQRIIELKRQVKYDYRDWVLVKMIDHMRALYNLKGGGSMKARQYTYDEMVQAYQDGYDHAVTNKGNHSDEWIKKKDYPMVVFTVYNKPVMSAKVATFYNYEDAKKCRAEQMNYNEPSGSIQLHVCTDTKDVFASYEDWKSWVHGYKDMGKAGRQTMLEKEYLEFNRRRQEMGWGMIDMNSFVAERIRRGGGGML